MSAGLAVASMVSQSRSSIVRFCQYHFTLGVEHIFLYFDYPEEADIPELRADPRVTVTLCDAAYWERLNVERCSTLRFRISATLAHGLQSARDADYRYVALIDSDEFLYTDLPLKKALEIAFADADVACLYPEEAIHDPTSIENGDFSHRHFKCRTNRLNRMVVPTFYSRINEVPDEGFLGHLVGKNIFRTDVEYSEMDMHAPILAPGFTRKRTEAIVLLHFDCMQFDDWKKKWELRFSGRAIPNMRQKRARQYEQIRQAAEAGDIRLRNLYHRYYLYENWHLRLGRLMGVIDRPKRLQQILDESRPRSRARPVADPRDVFSEQKFSHATKPLSET